MSYPAPKGGPMYGISCGLATNDKGDYESTNKVCKLNWWFNIKPHSI